MYCLLPIRADKRIKHCRIKLEGRLYTIGVFQFENLVELVNYYKDHPLYKNLKLTHPVGHCPALLNQTDPVCIIHITTYDWVEVFHHKSYRGTRKSMTRLSRNDYSIGKKKS